LLSFVVDTMEAHYINKAVKELLDKLVHDLPGYRWDSLCSYNDGQGVTLIELNIFRRDGQETAGRIAYQLETGEVFRFHYAPIRDHAPESILDFLLDVYNFEKRMSDSKASL
jgi:hypothetical protein